MSRDGSGTYTLPEAAFVTGTTIESAKVNNDLSDIASAMTASLAKDGQTTPTANLPMGGFKHTNVADATARTQYQSAAQAQDGGLTYASVSGTDTYTASLSPALTAYAAGNSFRLKFTNANTSTAPTINLNSLGAKTITLKNGSALIAGDIAASGTYVLTYDGTNFQLDSPSVSANAVNKLPLVGGILTGDLTITSTDAGAGEAPDLTLNRDSASPAAADILGGLKFDGKDSGNNQTTYARIRALIDDPTNGSEDGQIDLRVQVAGTELTVAEIDAGGLYVTDGTSGVQLIRTGNIEIIKTGGDAFIDFKNSAGEDFDLRIQQVSGGNGLSLQNGGGNNNIWNVQAANTSGFTGAVCTLTTNQVAGTGFYFLGCYSDIDGSIDAEFLVRGDGNIFGDGAAYNTPADYGEYRETHDGKDISVGVTVTLVGNKVRATQAGDDPRNVIGVVRPKSGEATLACNSATLRWAGTYEKTPHGAYVLNPDGSRIVSKAFVKDVDSATNRQRYVPRSERPEWVLVGMLGAVTINKGQLMGDRWLKMRDVTDSIEEWHIR